MNAGRDVLSAVPQGLLVGGEWRAAAAGDRFPVVDPGTEEPLAEVADAGAEDAVRALDAAVGAQDAWAATAPRVRSEILRRAFDLMTQRADDLALLVTLEMGKPVAESRAEVAYAADFLRWFAEEAVRVGGEYRPSPDGTTRILTTRQPVGPCLLITPWNFPLAMITRKVGAAVAAGCTMVLKPAEETPLSALVLAALLAEAGLPPAVLNVVTTSRPAEVSAPLLADPRLRKVSFTGSTEVGRTLLTAAARNVLRTSMELGGNAPFLVLADADVEAAVEGAMLAKLRNVGQSCVAANRFLVHERHSGTFARALADRLAALTVGHGADPATQVGPLIDGVQRSRIVGLLDDARSRGARVLTGGGLPARAGFYLEPTVVVDVPPGADVTRQEIFGPVAAVQTFDSDEALIAAANDSDQGLVAYLYTENLSAALRAADALEAGMVGVNRGVVSNAAAPFGGVKQSGLGREGGFEGIDEYLALKYVALNA